MKHISTKTIAGLAAFLLFMPACTNELNETPASEQAIVFGPQADTRAAVENTGELGSFSVWGWYTKTTPVQIFGDENGGTTVESPNWTYEGGARYWVPGATYNFYGVYPNTVDAQVSNGVITVPSFDCSATGNDAVDLMTAFATGDGDNPAKVNMNFGHELVRVNFMVQTEEGTVYVNKASLIGMMYKGTLTRSNEGAVWSKPVFAPEGIFQRNTELEVNVKGIALLDEMLLPVQTIENEQVSLSLSYHYFALNEEYKKTVTLPAITWEAGKSYTYTLTIESDGRIHFDSPVIDQWDEALGGIIIVD